MPVREEEWNIGMVEYWNTGMMELEEKKSIQRDAKKTQRTAKLREEGSDKIKSFHPLMNILTTKDIYGILDLGRNS